MADPQIIDEWLKKADEDYAFAVSIVEDSTFYAQICFHFHQAAEKYLKTYINESLIAKNALKICMVKFQCFLSSEGFVCSKN